MTLRIVAVAILVMLLPAVSQAQDRGSESDQDACRPDVFRLCADAILDETKIVSCLNRRVAELDPACRRVIDPAPPRRKDKPTARRGA